MELRLTGSEKDLKLVLLPLKLFAVLQPAIDADRLRKRTRSAGPRGRVGYDPPDIFQRPTLRPVMPLQIGNPTGVIVVDVSGYDEVELRYAVVFAQLVQMMGDEAHRLHAVVIRTDVHVREESVSVVNEHRLATLAEDDVEVRAGPIASPTTSAATGG